MKRCKSILLDLGKIGLLVQAVARNLVLQAGTKVHKSEHTANVLHTGQSWHLRDPLKLSAITTQRLDPIMQGKKILQPGFESIHGSTAVDVHVNDRQQMLVQERFLSNMLCVSFLAEKVNKLLCVYER